MDQISIESEELISSVVSLLDKHQVNHEIKEIDLSHAESIWYEIIIKTRPESELKLVMQLFRDAIGIFCNDHQVFICLSEKPADFKRWIEYSSKVISAVFRPEIRIRGRRSLFSGKKAAIWLELPEGGKWLGDTKACGGAGKESVFTDWF